MIPYINEDTLEFPVYEDQIKALFPNVSFATVFEPTEPFARVYLGTKPAHDRILDDLRLSAPEKIEGVWTQNYEVVPLDAAQVQENLMRERQNAKAKIREKKWQLEVQGIVIPGGGYVSTRVEDQNRITSVLVIAPKAGVETIDFESTTGFVTLTIAELEQISIAIGLRVQALYSASRFHQDLVDTFTQAAQFDDYLSNGIHQNWPN